MGSPLVQVPFVCSISAQCLSHKPEAQENGQVSQPSLGSPSLNPFYEGPNDHTQHNKYSKSHTKTSNNVRGLGMMVLMEMIYSVSGPIDHPDDTFGTIW